MFSIPEFCVQLRCRHQIQTLIIRKMKQDQTSNLLWRSIVLLFIGIGISSNSLAQSTQTIRGKVIDEVSKTPIPGANIIVLSGEGKQIGASSDSEGEFRILNVPVGRQTVQVSFLGYEVLTIPNVVVTSGKEVILNLELVEKVNQLDEIEITENRKDDKTLTNNELAVVSARSFVLDDTKRYAGALGDPARMAANFAGVVGGNDSRNDIVVRGNSPLGMLWQLEGLNIPNPNHFGALVSTGGPVSMLNSNNLDKSDFLSSAFPSTYGNATAGVFDIRLRDGNNEKREYVGQIGFNGFEFGAEGPFSKNSKASYIVNYRYSTLGVFQQLGIEFGAGGNIPIYQDLNFKLSIPTKSNSGKFTFFGIVGNSSIDLLGSDIEKEDLTSSDSDLYGDENEDSFPEYATRIFGLSYEKNLSKKTFAKLTVGFNSTSQSFRSDSLVRNADLDVIDRYQSGEANFSTETGSIVFFTRTKISSKSSLTSGFYIDASSFDLFNRDFFANLSKDSIRVDVQDNAQLYQAYTNWRYRFTDQLSLNLGAHAQYYSLNEQFVVEPRASLKYQINGNHGISIGYGLHNQTQNIYTTFVQTKTDDGYELNNRDLEFTTNNHFVLSYDWNITDQLRFKAEAYYQRLSNVPVERTPSSFSAINTGSSFGPDDTGNLINDGSGTNQGLELTLERFFNQGYYFLITASLFDSKYEGSDGVERNSAYNTRRVINVLAGKEWKLGQKNRFLSVNLKVSSIGGRYLTPLDFTLSQAYGRAIFRESEAFSQRQDDYFRADLRIAYRKEYKKTTLEASVDFQNVTANENIFLQSYNPRTNSIGTQYQQGFFPVPSIRFTF